MKYDRRLFLTLLSAVFLCLLLSACTGNSPWRYDPGAPERPLSLTATADNGQVSLSWSAADKAAAYVVYCATSPGVVTSSSIKIATVVGTSYIKTGLTNNTTYYFAISSVNSSGESALSSEVSAIPAQLGSYVAADVEGVWNFNALVSGVGAGWMRGSLVVGNSGAVTFSSFLDNAGQLLAPAGFLPGLFVSSAGQVRDANVGTTAFQGVMAASRKMIVGNFTSGATAHALVILQKQVPGVIFSNSGDLQGFGNSGGGGRRFVYHQLASGSNQEWEYAAGQIGRDQKLQYTTLTAPSSPAIPGDKASVLNISVEGIVTETRTAVLPQPATVIDRGVMSADKTVIVATATDTSGTAPRYILRIYQLVNIIANDPDTFIPADLAGTYDLRELRSGASSVTASGVLTIADSGAGSFSSYLDSTASVTLPPDFTLAMDAGGVLSNAADSSLLGKLSYFKDMFVETVTEPGGIYRLGIALKR